MEKAIIIYKISKKICKKYTKYLRKSLHQPANVNKCGQTSRLARESCVPRAGFDTGIAR